eukprot:PLAT12091.1.p2 GENE.PLAT12091.1~~PLAT12091.1.p2  ORF type:complete len:132 (+),score=26.49 PLAT12091.1:3-398(+)
MSKPGFWLARFTPFPNAARLIMSGAWRRIRLPTQVIAMVRSPGRDYGRGKVVFRVPVSMSKPELKEYLEKLYDVRVKSVNTTVYDGKTKRFGRRHFRTSGYKKAIVTLQRDDVYDLEAASDAAEASAAADV